MLNLCYLNMSENVLLTAEYQQLLRDLKGIIEGLLISRVANVWNVYGGLNRLHSVVESIFKHQCKTFNSDVSFIELRRRLRFLVVKCHHFVTFS